MINVKVEIMEAKRGESQIANHWAWNLFKQKVPTGLCLKMTAFWDIAPCSPLEQWYSTGGTQRHLRGYIDYPICITYIMYQQLLGVQSWREIISGGTRTKKVEYHCSRSSEVLTASLIRLPWEPEIPLSLFLCCRQVMGRRVTRIL
jgi:hypothetical protein